MGNNTSHPTSPTNSSMSTKKRNNSADGGVSESPDRAKGAKTKDLLVMDALSNVSKNYHINQKEVGHGHYGVVRKCMHRDTKEWYAIKSIRKQKVSKVEVLKREIAILQEVNHPHIIKLKEVHEDKKYIHLITDLCTGGELFDRIIAKTQSTEGHFSEHDAGQLIYDICDAISYCHDKKPVGIVHRDLKPENFLFATADERAPIKIIDFGLSRYSDNGNDKNSPMTGIMNTRVGTPYYIAPEVLSQEYTKSCDIWSIGVITYILLCGYPPFYGDSDTQIFESVRVGTFSFPSPEWDDISASAKNFVRALLKMTPSERLTASEAKNHKWMKEQQVVEVSTTTAATVDIANAKDQRKKRNSSVLLLNSDRSINYQKFMGLKKLKMVAFAEIATHLTQKEVGELGFIFKSMDKDGDGTLALQDLDDALEQSTVDFGNSSQRNGNNNGNNKISGSLRDSLEELRAELLSCLSGQDTRTITINWKEFLAATMDKNMVMREDKVRLAFDHFKKSDDDCLLFTDLVEIFGGEPQAREIMGFVDSDGDGQISFDEFRNAIQESM